MRPKATIIAPEPHAIHRGISFSWIVWNLTVILGSLVSVSLSVKSVGMQRAPSRSFCSMAAHVRYCLGDHFPTRGFLSTCRLVSLSLSNSTNGLSFWTCILHPVSMLCPGITGHVDSSDSRCTSPGHVNSSDSSCTSPVHTCGWHVNSSYSFISSETYSPCENGLLQMRIDVLYRKAVANRWESRKVVADQRSSALLQEKIPMEKISVSSFKSFTLNDFLNFKCLCSFVQLNSMFSII